MFTDAHAKNKLKKKKKARMTLHIILACFLLTHRKTFGFKQKTFAMRTGHSDWIANQLYTLGLHFSLSSIGKLLVSSLKFLRSYNLV